MKKVGIVGKVNVGKSTLFNRLVKRGKSIVSPVAGTTRDFISGRVNRDGMTFELIDFGGSVVSVPIFIPRAIFPNTKNQYRLFACIDFVRIPKIFQIFQFVVIRNIGLQRGNGYVTLLDECSVGGVVRIVECKVGGEVILRQPT